MTSQIQSIDSLDPDAIRNCLRTKRIGSDVVVYKSTTSTNDIAARYAPTPENDGLAIFAEQQTAGRGRAGSCWHSIPGASLLCSLLLTKPACGNELLSLTTAVAVADCIGKTSSGSAEIKWPNDIVLNGKKVAGILLETAKTPAADSRVVGIGINCHQRIRDFPEEIRRVATSVDIESATRCNRTILARRLLWCLDQWLHTAANSPETIIRRWRRLSIQLNHRITLVYNGRRFSGTCIDVDPRRGLVLQLDTGAIRMFDAAHTSVYKGRQHHGQLKNSAC